MAGSLEGRPAFGSRRAPGAAQPDREEGPVQCSRQAPADAEDSSRRPGAWGGNLAEGRGASRWRCQRSNRVRPEPAAGTCRARRVGPGAARRPGTPDRQGRSSAGSCRVAAAGWRSCGATRGSLDALSRSLTRSSRSKREQVRPTQVCQSQQHRRPWRRNERTSGKQPSDPHRPPIATLTWADEILGTHNVTDLAACPTRQHSPLTS